MFATNSTSKDYHLVQPGNDQTVCGLAVAPVIVDRPIKTGFLYLTSEPPTGKSCCERCAAATNRDRS